MPIIYVVKRNGRKEEFAYEKIVVSCMKAGAPLDVARKIAKIVEAKLLESGVSEVSAKELTKMVLELLSKKENEEWYRSWIIFDRAVKRRKTEEELKETKP
jgi:transcriptional regulator NrdR family protein